MWLPLHEPHADESDDEPHADESDDEVDMMPLRRWLTYSAVLVIVLTVSISVSQNRGQRPTPEGMVWIPGGTFWMGCEGCEMPDALPVHQVVVDGFWMDITPVTNEQFEKFVKATGYVTVAERAPDAKDFPDAPAENLVPGSAVFSPPAHDFGFYQLRSQSGQRFEMLGGCLDHPSPLFR